MKSESNAGLIGEIERCTTVDGPGIRTIVFMKGCPLRCLWCHNPENLLPQVQIGWEKEKCIGCGRCVRACPRQAIVPEDSALRTDESKCVRCGACVNACPTKARKQFGHSMTAEEVFEKVVRDRLFYETSRGGVTFSGGDPLAQPDFLEEALRRCREARLHTAVDTCGYAPRETVARMLPYTSLFLFDLKQADAALHEKYCGVNPELIFENLAFLNEQNVPVWIRTPVVPGMTDSRENIEAIARRIEGLACVQRWELLPFHRFGESKYRQLGGTCPTLCVEPPAPEEMNALLEAARGHCAKEIYIR